MPLRMLAVRMSIGDVVGSDVLISEALTALLADVDTPSLRVLAGLTRAEEPEAHDLFRAVIDELSLSRELPPDPRAARWELIRWWCSEMVTGNLPPEVAGDLIWREGWNELGYPDSLQPIVGWTSEWEDWTPAWGNERDEYRDKIVAEARVLLNGPWPPD